MKFLTDFSLNGDLICYDQSECYPYKNFAIFVISKRDKSLGERDSSQIITLTKCGFVESLMINQNGTTNVLLFSIMN